MVGASIVPHFWGLKASLAMDLPAELLERCNVVLVNETESGQSPARAEAKLVAVT